MQSIKWYRNRHLNTYKTWQGVPVGKPSFLLDEGPVQLLGQASAKHARLAECDKFYAVRVEVAPERGQEQCVEKTAAESIQKVNAHLIGSVMFSMNAGTEYTRSSTSIDARAPPVPKPATVSVLQVLDLNAFWMPFKVPRRMDAHFSARPLCTAPISRELYLAPGSCAIKMGKIMSVWGQQQFDRYNE